MTEHSLQIQNAELAYNQSILFTQLNLTLHANTWTAILGPSGIGKTSLLRCMVQLKRKEETFKGRILLNGTPASHPVEQIAYMAQTDLLLPWLSLLANVTLHLKLDKHSRAEKKAEMNRAKELLIQVGLNKAWHLYPHQLSGGMRQRAALVRTLMKNKPIVLMDEPFSALDAITRYKLQELAVQVLKDKTVLFITHDPLEAMRLAHKVYLMQGKPATLKLIADLHSSIPRELEHPEILALHTSLFKELSHESMCEVDPIK